MNAVTFLILYAVALSWLAPALLHSSLAAELPPRLSVAGWLVTVGTALSAWMGALGILIVGSAKSLITNTALTFCVGTLGITNAVLLPRTAATVLVVALLTVTAAVAVETTRRVILALGRTRRSNRDHVEAVQIIGRPTDHDGVVAVSADRPTAYCVTGGRRSAIVVTTAALDLLTPAGLAAVLAHERAHLRGRHHHIIATLNALAAALPRLPLMRAAACSVPPLLEMCADDAASRRHGRAPLLTSLVALSTRHRLPEGALAAAGTAVVERAVRLTGTAPQYGHWPRAAALALLAATALTAPTVAVLLCTL
ncbi:M56 family metallopeptidase [Mycolicibacterium sp.]|uniref:M56 family metallopeptidase n=1 Tax=Mycolicibacterium sp. TaxID=2320850 RepID=UPI0037C5B008